MVNGRKLWNSETRALPSSGTKKGGGSTPQTESTILDSHKVIIVVPFSALKGLGTVQ